MATCICIDVDLTLVDETGQLLPGAAEGLKLLKENGCQLTLWSHCGEDYARSIARKHRLCCYFDGYATKPDLVIDDDAETVSQLPAIDPQVAKDWPQIAGRAIQLAEDLDNRGSANDAPPWLKAMWRDRFNVGVQSSIAIWRRREAYFR